MVALSIQVNEEVTPSCDKGKGGRERTAKKRRGV
jgi:hypothetical protein